MALACYLPTVLAILKDLGLFGVLALALGGLGAAVALATLVLLLLKKPAAKATGVLGLLAAGATLALGPWATGSR